MTQRTSSDERLIIFSFLLAAAVIFHVGKWNIWLHSPVSLLLGVSAVSVLLKPSSAYRLYALLLLVVADAFGKMPWIPNHWLFAAIVSLTILSSASIIAIRHRRITTDTTELFETFTPAVRLELVLLYFFAFFHKLNLDWLDPDVSCGTMLLYSSLHLHGLHEDDSLLRILPVYGTLIVEAAIPLFLLFRKTRIAGIIIALIFHFFLGVFEYYNFSALTYAVLYLFAPDNFPDQLREWWRGSSVRGIYLRAADTGLIGRYKTPALAAAGVVCLALFIYASLSYPVREPHIALNDPAKTGKTRLYYAFLCLWWIYGISLTGIFLLSLRTRHTAIYRDNRYFIPAYTVIMLFPLLIVINGASPYLGLKTQTSWSMFSNLRTEGGYSNHLVIRRPYYMFGYQTDLVEVRRSSDPVLNVFQDSGYLIPYFELRRYLSTNRSSYPASDGLEYVRNGGGGTVLKPADDPVIFEPENYLLRKFLSFRPVPSVERGFCQH